MGWQPPDRNFDGVQHAEFRAAFDTKFNEVHDELTAAYYDGTPFRSVGVLTKEQYDGLHSLLWWYYDLKFHELNQRRPQAQRIPEAEYNVAEVAPGGTITLRKSEVAAIAVAQLEALGIELSDLKAL